MTARILVNIRVQPHEKTLWADAAKSQGLTLTDFLREAATAKATRAAEILNTASSSEPVLCAHRLPVMECGFCR